MLLKERKQRPRVSEINIVIKGGSSGGSGHHCASSFLFNQITCFNKNSAFVGTHTISQHLTASHLGIKYDDWPLLLL